MQFVFSVLLAAFFAANVSAQSIDCQLPDRAAVGLHGLKLGMSPQQARRAVGNSLKIKNKISGRYVFFQNFIKNSPPPLLPQARAVYLRFFDGRLYQIESFYDERHAPDLESFAAELAGRFGFPASDWKIEYGIAEAFCGNVSIIADYVLNPRVQLTDEAVQAIARSRAQK